MTRAPILTAQILAQWLVAAGLSGVMVAVAHAITTPAPIDPRWLWIGAAGIAAGGAGTWWSTQVTDRAVAQARVAVRHQLLDRVLRAGTDRTDRAGSTVHLLTDGVERFTAWDPGFRGRMIGQASSPVIALGMAAWCCDWVSAAIVAACLPCIPAGIIAFQRLFRDVSSASRRARAALATRFLEAIQHLEMLTVLGASTEMGDRLAALGEANRRRTMSLLARNQLVIWVTDLTFSLFVTVASAVVGYWRLTTGAIGLTDALGLILIGIVVANPIQVVGSYFYVGLAGRAAGARISQLLRTRTPSIAAHPPVGVDETGTRGIRVRDLHLIRDGHDVLDGIDLNLGEGTHTVIIGGSGAGKSSLLSVLSGDLAPTRGQVWVDGVPLTAATRDRVRQRTAVVRPHTWLFRASLADNLRLGAPEASEQQLWDALVAVDLANWAQRLPEGLDTCLGERSVGVSGGQAQRISVARAICSGRPVLLLDEPTAHVDLASEQIILDAVRGLRDRTVVMVTHRRAAEATGDRVIELADGMMKG